MHRLWYIITYFSKFKKASSYLGTRRPR